MQGATRPQYQIAAAAYFVLGDLRSKISLFCEKTPMEDIGASGEQDFFVKFQENT